MIEMLCQTFRNQTVMCYLFGMEKMILLMTKFKRASAYTQSHQTLEKKKQGKDFAV